MSYIRAYRKYNKPEQLEEFEPSQPQRRIKRYFEIEREKRLIFSPLSNLDFEEIKQRSDAETAKSTPPNKRFSTPPESVLEIFSERQRKVKMEPPRPPGIPYNSEEPIPQLSLNNLNDEKEYVQPDDTPTFAKDIIKHGEIIRCATVHVEDFDSFYVQICDQISGFLQFEEYFTKCMEQVVYKADSVPDVDIACKGMYFAIFHKRKDYDKPQWYRVQLLEAVGKWKSVRVQLLDYGNILIIDHNELRYLPRSLLLDQMVMAIPCKFKVNSVTDSKVRQSLGKLLEQYLLKHQGQELIKFHHRLTKIYRRVDWVISSFLIHPARWTFITPVGTTISELILNKFFEEGEKPLPDPKYVRAEADTDWTVYENESNVAIVEPPLPLLDSWIAAEGLNRGNTTKHPVEHGNPQQAYFLCKMSYVDIAKD